MSALDNDITWLLDRLPPVVRVWRRSEPDFYGASYLIAQRLGRKKPPISFAAWRHGWLHLDPIIHPRLIAMGTPKTLNLVATDRQVEILSKFGWPNSVAVGLPFIYGDIFKLDAKPNSLLVMPGHTLPYTDHQWDQKTYVDQIVKLKPYFNSIVACVHSSCFAKGYWTPYFEKNGIPCIKGADTYDKNALLRLNCIFKSFEYVTTNTIGSHIAYAAYSGCKVSIYGDYCSPNKNDYRNDPYYQKYPGLLEYWIDQSQESVIRQHYPQFFTLPMDAIDTKKWGEAVTGAAFIKKPSEVAELLGWSLKHQVKGYLSEGWRLMLNPGSFRKLLARRKIAQESIA